MARGFALGHHGAVNLQGHLAVLGQFRNHHRGTLGKRFFVCNIVNLPSWRVTKRRVPSQM